MESKVFVIVNGTKCKLTPKGLLVLPDRARKFDRVQTDLLFAVRRYRRNLEARNGKLILKLGGV